MDYAKVFERSVESSEEEQAMVEILDDEQLENATNLRNHEGSSDEQLLSLIKLTEDMHNFTKLVEIMSSLVKCKDNMAMM